MSPTLAVCIPTYNRAPFLREALQSITEQSVCPDEVVVVDNASSDDTGDVVAEFMDKFPALKYQRWAENRGPDYNFLAAVKAASADYCWLMGSDDLLHPDAVKTVREALDTDNSPTGISVGHVICSKDLSETYPERPISWPPLATNLPMLDGALAASRLGVYLGYLSAHLVHRSRWLAAADRDLNAFMKGFVHVKVMSEMMKANGNWLYLARPLVVNRAGNDSFLVPGRLLDRQILAHQTFFETLSSTFPSEAVLGPCRRHVVHHHLGGDLRGIKTSGTDASTLARLFMLYAKHYGRVPAFWYKIVPQFLVPAAAISFLRRLAAGRRN